MKTNPDADSGKAIATCTSPQTELRIDAPHPGWAEQSPETWWKHLCIVAKALLKKVNPKDVEAIGISYQMHGLVLVDNETRPLRPAIIWCDGRTQAMGDKAAKNLGPAFLKAALNYPGNFTASKIAWVRKHEPKLYAKAYKAILPGDYLAAKLTGEICTTPSGLSEGILWNFKKQELLDPVLDYYGIRPELLADVRPTFSVQGEVTGGAARETGFRSGTPVAYRAGDQPNNALSLGVLEPGEVAATAGTSGVIYAVTDKAVPDRLSRVNVFVHVNHNPQRSIDISVGNGNREEKTFPSTALRTGLEERFPLHTPLSKDLSEMPSARSEQTAFPQKFLEWEAGESLLSRRFSPRFIADLNTSNRYGILACINGTGSLYRWLRELVGGDYAAMNRLAEKTPPGADGMIIIPYGNGPERTQLGRNTGMSIHHADLNRHGKGHVARSAQEGIVFALKQGTDVMAGMGVRIRKVRAGKTNMFQSELFTQIFASAIDATVELMNTDGSQGAARGAGIGCGTYKQPADAFIGLTPIATVPPDPKLRKAYRPLYARWAETLQQTFR